MVLGGTLTMNVAPLTPVRFYEPSLEPMRQASAFFCNMIWYNEVFDFTLSEEQIFKYFLACLRVYVILSTWNLRARALVVDRSREALVKLARRLYVPRFVFQVIREYASPIIREGIAVLIPFFPPLGSDRCSMSELQKMLDFDEFALTRTPQACRELNWKYLNIRKEFPKPKKITFLDDISPKKIYMPGWSKLYIKVDHSSAINALESTLKPKDYDMATSKVTYPHTDSRFFKVSTFFNF